MSIAFRWLVGVLVLALLLCASAVFRSIRHYGDGAEMDEEVPESYAAEIRATHPGIINAGVASFWRARNLPTD